MSEFDRASDWDLEAIVKGQTMISNIIDMPSSQAWFESLGLEDYKLDRFPTNSAPNFVDTAMPSIDDYTKHSKQEKKEKSMGVSYANTRETTSSRRRKNKHKINLIQQATGDRVLSDKWNWRKYGEKIIKGSPYRRSYYRCSSSGGCLARKQVEQSSSNPALFLITYIDEHSHPHPTRRHSQAGRTTRKFNSSAEVLTTIQSTNTSARISTSETPLVDNRVCIKDDGSIEDVGGRGSVSIPNMVFDDDFFAGLDQYLKELDMDLVCEGLV